MFPQSKQAKATDPSKFLFNAASSFKISRNQTTWWVWELPCIQRRIRRRKKMQYCVHANISAVHCFCMCAAAVPAPTSIHFWKEVVCFCRAQLAERESCNQIIDSQQNLFAEGMHEIEPGAWHPRAIRLLLCRSVLRRIFKKVCVRWGKGEWFVL